MLILACDAKKHKYFLFTKQGGSMAEFMVYC